MIAYQQIVEDIRLFLQSGDTQATDQVKRLAAAYNGTCQEANLRLHRCGNLLAQGLRTEAIHLAQTEPVLLDMLAALDFPERKQWEQFCQLHSLPAPPALNMETATLINEAYADDEPLDELLRKHRLFALGRAPVGNRLGLLRRIAELDSRNSTWEDDIRIFERARLQQIENDLQLWIQRQAVGVIMTAANELAKTRWRVPPPAALVNKVQNAAQHFGGVKLMATLRDLEGKLNDAMLACDVPRTIQLRSQWNQLVGTSRPNPGDPIWARISLVLDWVEQQVRRQAEDGAYQSALSELQFALGQPRSQEELESVHAKVLQFGKGLPEPVAVRYQTVMRRHRSAARRRRALWVGVPLVLLLLAGGGAWWWQGHKGEMEKVQASVDAVNRMMEAGQFAEARAHLEKLQQTDPQLAAHRELQQLGVQLQISEKDEKDRQQLFQEVIKEAEEAPLDAAGDRLVDRAKSVARFPEEKTLVLQLQHTRKGKLDEARTLREKKLLPRINDFAADLDKLEEMLKKPYDPNSAIKMLSDKTVSLRELSTEASNVSESTRDLVTSLSNRLESARQSVQRSNSEAFALEELAVALDSKQGTGEFVAALQNYIKQFPASQRAADFKKVVAEQEHWKTVQAWQPAVQPFVAKPMDMGVKEARKVGEAVRQYVKEYPNSPDQKTLESYLLALDALATRDENDPKGAPAELRRIFSSLVIKDVWMLRTEDGKVYYANEDLQRKVKLAEGGAVSFDYLIGYDGSKRKALKRLSTITRVGMSAQSTIADEIRFLPENFAEKKWDEITLSFIKKIRESRDMDPVLQIILLRQVLECAGKASYPLAKSTAKHREEIDNARVDLTVAWLDPENGNAQKQRPTAREFVNQLPRLDKLAEVVAEEKQKLANAVAATYRAPVGFLTKDKSNQWHVSSRNKLRDGGELYVIVPIAEGKAEWRTIGKTEKGTATIASTSAEFLAEGRPVYMTKSK